MSPFYRDVHEMSEDARIDLIGLTCLERPGKKIGVCTDSDPGKAERYIEKMKAKFPLVSLVELLDGPIKNVRTIIFRRDCSGGCKPNFISEEELARLEAEGAQVEARQVAKHADGSICWITEL